MRFRRYEFYANNPVYHFLFWMKTELGVLKYQLLYSLPNRKAMKTTRLLRNTKAGQSAVVLGNGPSILKIDQNKLKFVQKERHCDVIAVNSFVSSAFFPTVIPDFYVLSDPLYFGDTNYANSTEELQQVLEDIRIIKENKIPLFVPVRYYDTIEYDRKFPFCGCGNVLRRNMYDITRPAGYLPYVTTYKAITLALFLGYKEIFICGIDNDYFRTLVCGEDNVLKQRVTHFYDEEGHDFKEMPVFLGHEVPTSIYFHYIAYLFTAVERFREYNIFNLDKDSYINSFSKSISLDILKD